MGDAVDILNLERPTKPALHRILYGSTLNAGVAKKAPSKADSKHASLHREMRLLSGSAGFHAEELTTLVPTETLSFKQSRRRDGATGKWLWQKFTNSARSDQLELFHWQKSTVVLDDYHFAKFNKSLGPRDFAMFAAPSTPSPPPDLRTSCCGRMFSRLSCLTICSGTPTKSTRHI
jgi:hypothetical protein